jgi:uncharacterized membrane protein (UPF0127 family)
MAVRGKLSAVTVTILLASSALLCACDESAPQPSKPESVQVGDKVIKLKLLTEERDRHEAAQKGTRPGAGEGTLLVYPAPEVVRIDTSAWTTPEDVVFMDRDGKVVGRKEEPAPVAQGVVPKAGAKVFTNTSPAFFTLMLPAGVGATIKEGESLRIDAARLIKQAQGPLVDVQIAGRTFHLEQAPTDEKRMKGLSDRVEIAPDGGMLFVFPSPVTTSFVMRDCPIPIDIIFLDGSGRVIAMYKMQVEPEATEQEKKVDPATGLSGYETRLKKYSSRFATQFVIELKANTLDTLKIKEHDKIDLPTDDLKKRAK